MARAEKDLTGRPIAYQWSMRPKRWTIEELSNLDMTDVMRMSTPERAGVAASLQDITKRRLASIHKAGEYSYVADRIYTQMRMRVGLNGKPLANDEVPDAYYGEAKYSVTRYSTNQRDFDLNSEIYHWNPQKRIYELGEVFAKYKDPHNALVNYISILNEAVNTETATLAGTRRVNKHWDAAVFGTNKRGNPLYRMTEPERRKFWRVYDELRTNYNGLIRGVSSPKDEGPVDQSLTHMWVAEGYGNMSFEEIVKRYTEFRRENDPFAGVEFYQGRYRDDEEERPSPFDRGNGDVDTGKFHID